MIQSSVSLDPIKQYNWSHQERETLNDDDDDGEEGVMMMTAMVMYDDVDNNDNDSDPFPFGITSDLKVNINSRVSN